MWVGLPSLPEVSPGFTPRPSLSDLPLGGVHDGGGGVAGVHTSAFVERSGPRTSCCARWGVAGVHTSAFVERRWTRRWRGRGRRVSPGFTPRPSLSAGCRPRVRATFGVSPGFTPRPSLSASLPICRITALRHVSPGFTPRPSLSDAPPGVHEGPRRGVAGVHTSAFVERAAWTTTWSSRFSCRRGSHLGLR